MTARKLTARQSEIVRLLARGYSQKEVAGILKIQQTTVAATLRDIHHKIGTRQGKSLVLLINTLFDLTEKPGQFQ